MKSKHFENANYTSDFINVFKLAEALNWQPRASYKTRMHCTPLQYVRVFAD